jgi:hypothetical protein
VLQQALTQGVQDIDELASRVGRAALRESIGRRLNRVEQVGDAPVVCLEPVDDRADFRVGRAQLGEERMVLGAVVVVDEAAVAEAGATTPI